MANDKPVYLSYLLRLWRVDSQNGARPGSEAMWRASLEDPHTHLRQGFADLDDLFEFLRAQTGLAMPTMLAPPATGRKLKPRWSQARRKASGRQPAMDRRFSR